MKIRIVSNADKVAANLRGIDNVLTRAALAVMELTVRRIQKRMQRPGAPIRYPVNWDTVKQMIAFFASDGFGEGIPYRRTGKRPNAWQMRAIAMGFELSNKEKGALFLYGRADGADISPGKKQSNIHKGRHPLFRPVVDEELKDLPENILTRIRLELSKSQ